MNRCALLGLMFFGTLGCSSSPSGDAPGSSGGSTSTPATGGTMSADNPGDGDGDTTSGGGTMSAATGGADSGTGGEPGSSTPWPDNKIAAVTLSYDDGLDGQLKNAVPALDARGLKGTFFLSSFQGVDHMWSLPNLTDELTVRHEAWAAVAASGHELGGHTIYHPCDNNNPGFQPADYDATRMAAELDEASQRLARLGATEPLSFAYPCAGDTVGIEGGMSYMPLVNDRYVAARVSTQGVSDPATLQLTAVSQRFGDAEGTSAADLIAYVDEAIAAGGWAVFTFHGIGPAAECDINSFDLDACALNYLTTENSEHEALLDYLVERQDEVWTAPMRDVAAHLNNE